MAFGIVTEKHTEKHTSTYWGQTAPLFFCYYLRFFVLLVGAQLFWFVCISFVKKADALAPKSYVPW